MKSELTPIGVNQVFTGLSKDAMGIARVKKIKPKGIWLMV